MVLRSSDGGIDSLQLHSHIVAPNFLHEEAEKENQAKAASAGSNFVFWSLGISFRFFIRPSKGGPFLYGISSHDEAD